MERRGGAGAGAPPLARSRWQALTRTIKEFLYGLSGYEFAQHALELRQEQEILFIMVTYGDMIGVPVMPPYYSLRLLPYVVPQIVTWKRVVLRERHPLDRHKLDLIGI